MMKRLCLFAILLLPVLLSSCGSPRSVNNFYHQNKRKEGIRNMTIPGWAIFMGTGIAKGIIREEEAKMALHLGKKVKKLQFMVAEDQNSIPTEEILSFVKETRKDRYEDLIQVRDKETTINFMVVDKKEKLKHILVLVSDESSFVFLNIRSNIRMKDISEVINYYMAKEGWSDDGDEEKKKKEAVPQV